MHVRVRLFAGLRDRAGAEEIELELPDGATVKDALVQLSGVSDGVNVVMAVNREYADANVPLHPDDELALIPPVSGGALQIAHARVTTEALSQDKLTALVTDPRAGAIVTFLGVTREVDQLDYQAYAEMAEQQLAEIVAQAIEAHNLTAAAAEHRIGQVPLSEPSVIVAASAPHRTEAFEGAREIIDRIKAQAPIWKREEGEWVQGTTPSS
ncbi:MAG TPA: molybdenum cofactor biosynthesis protein MoaE [Solirubrobacteraceae bacterium]|nr:molybdenum cofactor biosynthesis protein MoaE [Solirubrobacteraceae bacterium]